MTRIAMLATLLMLGACDNQTVDQRLAGTAQAYTCPEGTVAIRIRLYENANGAFCLREAVLKGSVAAVSP